MLTKDQIRDNSEKYKALLRSTNREGIEELINYLDNSDFFIAPASTKYHQAYAGGLCEHCLNVYNILSGVIEDVMKNNDIEKDSIIIASLCHDMAKINQYEETVFNKKVYSETGSKRDELGRFEWIAVKGYKTADIKDRIIFSNHETTSEYITRQFIPLRIEESVAIIHHHGGLGWDSINTQAIPDIYQTYPLAMYLHVADSIDAYTAPRGSEA